MQLSKSNNAERAFFEGMLSFESKGWNVSIPPGIQPGAIDLSNLTVHVYIVDVAGGQIWRGASTPADFQETLRQGRDQGLEIDSRIATAIKQLRCIDPPVSSDDEMLLSMVTLAAWGVAHSKTLEVAQSKYGLSGHWFMLHYLTKFGKFLNRPIYVSQASAGVAALAPLEIEQVVQHVVNMDCDQSQSKLAIEMRAYGGPVIHRRFQFPA